MGGRSFGSARPEGFDRMVIEKELIRSDERFSFDRELIDQVAFPIGDRYPEEIFSNYFFWYSGLVTKYKPLRILEIGVRYGYTGIVFCLAARKAGINDVEYLGIDDESYHARSCDRANQNLRQMVPFATAKALRWNSFDGLPPGCGEFDLIHIDGNHDTHGVFNDLQICWPVLRPGGVIVLDDYQMPQIERAIHQWLALFEGSEEIVQVQEVETERGHFLIRKETS
jgi:predicted O-methyltransferase YrrM